MIALVIGLVSMLLYATTYAQPRVIEVAFDRTVSLTFPTAVSHIDLGSTAIDARLVGPGSKVVLVKALEANFRGTNLTVVTERDEVYDFDVRYSSLPGKDHWIISPTVPAPNSYAASIMDNKKLISGVRDFNNGVATALQGIYVHKDHLYFHIKVENRTALGYDLAATRFLLVSRKGRRRAAKQEVIINPESLEGAYKQVPVHGSATFVAVLPKFSLSHNQMLHIDLIEQRGERNLRLRVPRRKFAQVAMLPNL